MPTSGDTVAQDLCNRLEEKGRKPDGMRASSLPLTGELETHVQVRTGRRIRNLRIELSAESVVLRGQTTTYYAKQLAQHGVRDLLPHVRLENAIVVVN